MRAIAMALLILGFTTAALLGFRLGVGTVAVALGIGGFTTATLFGGRIRCIAHRKLPLGGLILPCAKLNHARH